MCREAFRKRTWNMCSVTGCSVCGKESVQASAAAHSSYLRAPGLVCGCSQVATSLASFAPISSMLQVVSACVRHGALSMRPVDCSRALPNMQQASCFCAIE